MKRVNNGLKIAKSSKGYYGGSYYHRIRGTKGGIIPPFNIGLNCSTVLLKGIPQAVLVILTAFVEKERSDIRVRQAEGIEVAMRKGTKFGRPSKILPKEWDEHYLQWRNSQFKAVEFMGIVGMK